MKALPKTRSADYAARIGNTAYQVGYGKFNGRGSARLVSCPGTCIQISIIYIICTYTSIISIFLTVLCLFYLTLVFEILPSSRATSLPLPALNVSTGWHAMAAPRWMINKYTTYLEGWIRGCNDNHEDRCQVEPIAGRPLHHIPDWVIDTVDGCIVRGCSVQRYVALSYVWSRAGKDNVGRKAAAGDRLMLQKDNLVDFCHQGFLRSRVLERVPVVIQDAINFVRFSGFRYLWVDSLCIVQHEETTRDRVGLMNEIYSGAYFTIIAAASTKGLYGYKQYNHVRLPHGSTKVQHFHNQLLCSRWASRGWTFQEQLLSKRSIVFLDNFCFWDCQCAVWWPGFIKFERQDSSTPDNRLSKARQTQSSNRHPFQKAVLERVERKYSTFGEESEDHTSLSSVPDFRFYIELVCRYSNRNLTYDQDVLPAFSGVLEALARRSFRGGFVCGLPALFLDSALLWQPLLIARRRSESPVGTATKIAPIAPLPSWSWAGWQCLVDPDSLKSGLDYMIGGYEFYSQPTIPGRTPWRTCKLVYWYTFSDDGSVNRIHEPALLQSFKGGRKKLHHRSLPTEWSRDDTGDFVHASKPMNRYRYPLPTQDTHSTTTPDRNTSLLSCTTKGASLRVRRILIPCRIYDGRVLEAWSDTSVLDTDSYSPKPQLDEVCPVITLEDGKGRWAGAMTIMENTSSVQSGSEITMIAVSSGSALQKDVAASYPEMIDSQGYWCYGRSLDEYHFRPLDWHDGLDNGQGERRFSAAEYARESMNAGIDVGPFAARHHRDKTGAAIRPTVLAGSNPPYHFYNVLWVETIDGVMYRKSAGRVPKEVWELNCRDPTRIVLG